MARASALVADKITAEAGFLEMEPTLDHLNQKILELAGQDNKKEGEEDEK